MSQKKFHNRGFNEGIEESRAQRVGFKRYLRQLEEDMINDEDDDVVDDEQNEED